MIAKEDIKSIYNKHVDELYSYALHLGFAKDEIMDAIHDVFCKLCTDENVTEYRNVKFYLFKSLKNKMIDIYRKQKDVFDIHDLGHNKKDVFDIGSETVEDGFIIQEEEQNIRQKIHDMLYTLSPRQREIIYLRYIHEYSYEEIAQIMNINVFSCRKLVNKAIQTLRKNSTDAISTIY